EATEEDILAADKRHPVYEIKIAGLEYVPNVAVIAKPVTFIEPRISEEGRVRHAPMDNTEVLLETSVEKFTGQSRDRAEIPKVVYMVPIHNGVYSPHTTR